jgi:hypothetical protein
VCWSRRGENADEEGLVSGGGEGEVLGRVDAELCTRFEGARLTVG